MSIIKEDADKYQGLFNLMSKDHNLTLTISEMDEVISESKKVVKLFAVRDSIEAEITNGRMKIESTNVEGSDLLDKWINENKYCLDKRLDIEIYAH